MSEEKPDLAAVLEHYGVKLRGGRKQMVSCPLHDDATPSCSVDLDKGLWNCKSCHEVGDSYTLMMKMEDINFVRARALAASLDLATGVAGGGDEQVSGSRYGGRRSVARKSRPQRGGSSYVPAWRRS